MGQAPNIGRFISEDPARDDLNWYVYCGSNPVNFWDPLGKSESDDIRILDVEDYEKVLIYTAIYKWAEEEGEHLISDAARYQSVLIRQNPKYNGTGYGVDTLQKAPFGKLEFIGIVKGYQDNYNYKTTPTMFGTRYQDVHFNISEPISTEEAERNPILAEIDTFGSSGAAAQWGPIVEFAVTAITFIESTTTFSEKKQEGDVIVSVQGYSLLIRGGEVKGVLRF